MVASIRSHIAAMASAGDFSHLDDIFCGIESRYGIYGRSCADRTFQSRWCDDNIATGKILRLAGIESENIHTTRTAYIQIHSDTDTLPFLHSAFDNSAGEKYFQIYSKHHHDVPSAKCYQ